ncbi:MAG TPA: flagellar basal body P-ring formation chaperone FlgA [Patescibacteria group bacterium]|nr:flagellar basal body P-ring formation chaperone FlgA [Patescibacteria group bacterium]
MGNIVKRKKPDLKKLLMAVAMTAFMVNAAHAAEPALDVAVSGDVVTVGDVFPGVTHDAAYVLTKAPAYGKTLTLNAGDLKRISDAFSLGWTPVSATSQTVIRRASNEVGAATISAALQEALAEKLEGQKFEIQLNEQALLHVPESEQTNVAISELRYDLARGEVSAMVTTGANTTARIEGRLFPVTSVPVLKNQLQKGEMISRDDIDFLDIRNSAIGATVITSAEKLVGMSPRRGLAPLKPVTAADIMSPVVVKKGEIVTMVLQSAEMTLTTQGKALENGAAGETVRIINPSSGQSVEGVVTGVKTVSVMAPGDAGI